MMDEQQESLSESLMHSAANDYASGALVELGESFVDDLTDAALKSELATKIPVVGMLVAFGKGVLTFRDRRYVNKLLNFLAETGKASEEDKRKYREKLDANPDECKKAGEIILDLIDKITSTEKAIMIGKIVRAFMHEDDLTTVQVIALAETVEKAYLSDLTALARPDGEPGEAWNDANLESVGIKKPMRAGDVNKALQAQNSRLMAQMPVVREGPINTDDEPEVIESGFTEAGYTLRRILREY